jgi:hypothetical protein
MCLKRVVYFVVGTFADNKSGFGGLVMFHQEDGDWGMD